MHRGVAARVTAGSVWMVAWCLVGLGISQVARGAAEQVGFRSYPDLEAGRIVFLYQNDLWVVSSSGGVARRLTADGHPKTDVRLSRDGSRAAYTMTVEGNPDVYIVGVDTGAALRLTHHPSFDRALGWYPDNSALLIASRMASPHLGVNQLFRVPADGGLPEPIPLAYGETAAFSPDGHQLIYTSYRDFQDESWKRYRGGRAPHLRLFDIGTGTSRLLTEGEFSDTSPVWIGDTVYFLSERGPEHRSNLWSLSMPDGALEQLTHYDDFDVRHPAGSSDGLVFEHGGQLGLFDPRSHRVRELSIETPTQLWGGALRRESVAAERESALWVPKSEQTLIAAHGELFLVGAGGAPAVNVTRSCDAAERYPGVSDDGRRLAYFSDATGEYQLYVRDLPAGTAMQITHFASGLRFQPQWSPDSRHLAFIDSAHDISIVDTRTSKVAVVDHDLTRDPDGLRRFRVSWSPDGRWLAYSRVVDTGNSAVFLYDTQSGQRTQVTSGEINEQEPVFDAAGRTLFFFAAQALKPTFGDIDSTWTFAESMRIVGLSLNSGAPAQYELPVPRGVLAELRALPGRLVYRRIADAVEGQGVGVVETLDLVSGLVRPLVQQADELLDADATRGVLVARQGGGLVARSYAADAQEQDLATSHLFLTRDRPVENEQQLRDAWRYARDFFYDSNIHGVDWPAILRRYLPLARRAQTDEDMSFVLREVAGELGAGHTWAYSGHGHPPGWSDACVGLLGVDFTVTGGAYRIGRIYDGGALQPQLRSPLSDPALGIHAGTFVLAVNGQPLSVTRDPWAAFEGECDSLVELTLNDVPKLEGAHTVSVRTLRSETKLREADWVRVNRERVHEISGGQLGYIYVPDTSTNGITELVRQYRAEFRKPGLVIDERFNRGGAFGDRLVELLNRPQLAFFATRDARSVPLPELANAGPKALLINGWSYSGGDGFPFLFHAARAGTIVGTQTAGGFIGPGDPLQLTSGGVISVPVQRAFSVDGHWAGAGRGMRPDIEVDDDPADMARGRDHQLEQAVKVLLARLTAHPVTGIPLPPPVESMEKSR
ncbi:MAG: PD40 domain-containing protein [Proteobacteria bacterium]|nr:PD40 domain-containing protein [Pseudomonadota bacterium]